jgi:hypothetical protein
MVVNKVGLLAVTFLAGSCAALGLAAPPTLAVSSGVGPVTDVSSACAGQNAEVEQAVAPPHYVYEAWIGCGGEGFARSANDGKTFGQPLTLPDSSGSDDPAIAVAPDGTVYVSYLRYHDNYAYPVVATSFDHGATFTQVASLIPHRVGNWGDRDFIAAGRGGTVYVTACIVVQPNGEVDALMIDHPLNPRTFKVHPGHELFTRSTDGGKTWSRAVEVGGSAGTLSDTEWRIDGDLSTDRAGHLFATWDTHTSAGDIGWLSYSTDGGRTWSPPTRVTPDHDNAVHIAQSAAAGPGIVDIAWLADNSPRGYATYLRPFSVKHGWLAPVTRVSSQYGNPAIWPGDTFGISVLKRWNGPGAPEHFALSWGSAVSGSKNSEIYATVVGR